MFKPHIHVSADGRVLVLTIDRPGRKNALTYDMYRALTAALDGAGRDPAIRAVVLAGQRECFSSGNDIGDFVKDPPLSPGNPISTFLRALSAVEKPVLAAVNGVAVGIGATMLLHCDFVQAGDNALFAMPFVTLGVCPEAAASLLLPRLVGVRRAAEMLLLGRQLTAAQALADGFINTVLPPEDTLAHTLDLARRLAALPGESLAVSKRFLTRNDPLIAQRMEQEFTEFARLLQSPDSREAMAAFLEKRPPNFAKA